MEIRNLQTLSPPAQGPAGEGGTEMKLAVVGSRSWKDWIAVLSRISKIKPELVITGGAAGADRMAMDAAERCNIYSEVYYPKWKEDGRKAGAIRNKQIVDACDKLIAFWDGKSKGTKISIDMAKAQGKLLEIVLQ